MNHDKLISRYKNLTPEEYDAHFQDYLINSWSYSKVSQFARNQKAFEMVYIYNQRSKSSSTTVAGQAYHKALESYFKAMKAGKTMDLAELEIIVFEHIDTFPIPLWKCQKTTPTIEECRIDCTKTVTALLRNFFAEVSTYIDEIDEIIEVEAYYDEWLMINGVDIPLPCHAMIDVSLRTKDGKIVLCDHKSVKSFTDEKEMRATISKQAIVYVKAFEEATGIDVDEVWFIQNKYSKNKDGSKQLNKHRVVMDKNARRLYELKLYEPLRAMLQAINDPDYTYIRNEDDKYVDSEELEVFWLKTLLSEVEEFNIKPDKQDLIARRLKKIRDVTIATINPQVIKEFKKNASSFIQYDLSNMDMTNEEKIIHALRTFGILVDVPHKFEDGYSSNTFLIKPSAGVKLASIQRYKLDIANALDVESVRISPELVVHEGKSYLAIDVAKKRDKDLLFNPDDLVKRRIPIGKDNFGNTLVWDWDNNSTPHVLVCGATGSGKSVSIRSDIEYGLLTGVDEIIIFDPKYEFLDLADRSRRIKVYNEILDIENKAIELVEQMDELVRTGKKKALFLVADEFGDIIARSRKGPELDIKEMVQVGNYKDTKGPLGFVIPGKPKMQLQKTGQLRAFETNLKILAQKSRSVGYRILVATQRASTDIVNGDTKVNFPVQICFQVPKEIDSSVVLGEGGAEGLGGKGDFLMRSSEYRGTVRGQAYFTPTEVVEIIEE